MVFAGPGDFEGIALKGNTAYVVRADGVLYEFDMTSNKKSEHNIGSALMQNIESLAYDAKNNRLLLTGKDEDPALPGYKGIYAFDLSGNSLVKDPVFKIELKEEPSSGKKGKNKALKPSALGVQPISNDIYILDGPKARLLWLDNRGNLKNSYELGNQFAQPEGISFSPQGDLYISNEGKKEAANIIALDIR